MFTPALGVLYVATFVAVEDLEIAHLFCQTGGTQSGAGATLQRMALLEMGSGSGGRAFTMVARTANDTSTFLVAQDTMYSRAFDTAGGYPASYVLTPGQRYGIGFLIVGNSTRPTVICTAGKTNQTFLSGTASSTLTWLDFCQASSLGSQTDIPTSGTLNSSIGVVPWFGCSI